MEGRGGRQSLRLGSGFIYTGIHFSDLERSVKLYTKDMGMKLLFKGQIKETGGKVAWLKSERTGQILGLNWYLRGYSYGGSSGLDHLAFSVSDAKTHTHNYLGRGKTVAQYFLSSKGGRSSRTSRIPTATELSSGKSCESEARGKLHVKEAIRSRRH